MLRVHQLRRLSLVLTICIALGGNTSIAAEATRPAGGNVAVILSADVEPYKEALKGFRRTSRSKIVAEYNMHGDLNEGKRILNEVQTSVKPDLIYAVGIWALQLVAERKTDIPAVYSMVLNPQSIIKDGAKNITGASMNVPVELTAQLLKQLSPKIQRVGVVFNKGNTGYLITQATAVAKEQGLQLVAKEIRSSKEAIGALDSLWEEGVDAIWIPPDESVLAQAVVEHMMLVSYRRKTPLVGISERHAQMGALLSLSFASSEDIGRQAGELANLILAGKPVAEIPPTTARQVSVIVNVKAAQRLGFEIPKPVMERASRVIQ